MKQRVLFAHWTRLIRVVARVVRAPREGVRCDYVKSAHIGCAAYVAAVAHVCGAEHVSCAVHGGEFAHGGCAVHVGEFVHLRFI